MTKKIILCVLLLFAVGAIGQNIDLKKGLVAYYPFNGNALDESGNFNQGFVYKARLTEDRFNKPKSAYYFTGFNSYIDIPNSDKLNFSKSFSIVAWIEATNPDLSPEQPAMVVSKHHTVNRRSYDIEISNIGNGKLEIIFKFFDINDKCYQTKSTTDYFDGNWHMITGIYDYSKGTAYLYLDDEIIAVNKVGQVIIQESDCQLVIGAYMLNVSERRGFFYGAIDDVRLYQRNLSDSEVKELFKNPNSESQKQLSIEIISPEINRGFVAANTKTIEIVGRITTDGSKINATLNNQSIKIGKDGFFKHLVNLSEGNNNFTIVATDDMDNSQEYSFSITYNPNTPNNQPEKDAKPIANKGVYYALIIANNVYNDPSITSLNEPINDATKLINVLTYQYTFDLQNVYFLKNATYIQIISAFDRLNQIVTPDDNLLIFYAGHGWWDENKKIGYWLPTDASKSNTAYWIPNSRICDYMSIINSKHTLLIADACFSGSIFKTRTAFSDAPPSINKLYELKSRKAMTSGNLKEVPDKSAFLYYLVMKLEQNKEKYLSSDILFSSFRQAVLNNSTSEPQYGTVHNTGDEGGEFIFIRR